MSAAGAAGEQVYRSALAVALGAWGTGAPGTDKPDLDPLEGFDPFTDRDPWAPLDWTDSGVQGALDGVVDALCTERAGQVARGVAHWLLRVDESMRAHPDGSEGGQVALRELPAAQAAIARLRARPPRPAPDPGWPLHIGVTFIAESAIQMFTPLTRRRRAQLYWSAIALALLAWAEPPDRWAPEALRERAVATLGTAARALAAPRAARLHDSLQQLQAVRDDLRAARRAG